MDVKAITVTAQQSFPNPYRKYNIATPSIVITAELSEDDDVDKCGKELRDRAEVHVLHVGRQLYKLWERDYGKEEK